MPARVLTGIDFGQYAVRLAAVEMRKKRPRLIAFDSERIEQRDTPLGDADHTAGWATALRALVKRRNQRPSALGRVALGVGGESVTVRQIELPDLSDEELANAMPLEARRHVPIQAETEIALSFQVLNRDPVAKKVSVLLGACPKSLVQSAVRVSEQAGLDPEIVDAAPLAALNAVIHAHDEQDEAIGLLDIGRTGSTLTLFRPGELLLCRRAPVGGDAMTEELAKRRDIAIQEAEALKTGDPRALAAAEQAAMLSETLPTSELADLVETSVASLAKEVRVSINFFDSRTGRKGLKRILLTGAGARVAGLAQALERLLSLPVSFAEPFPAANGDTIATPDIASRLQNESEEFAVAIGLTRWWESAEA
jgi:type IV pilus assembly protein PilM